jgi:D-3-phosphoglycerate dehydrogenase / 2-oxoglutarate reductase
MEINEIVSVSLKRRKSLMPRILVTDGMEKSARESLQNSGFEVVERFFEPDALESVIGEFDGVVVRSATKITKNIIDAAIVTGKLKLILRGGVGIDNIEASYAKEKGIAVHNTPAASSASVAELALCHILNLARHVGIANHTMRLGQWNKKKYEGIEVGGKTLGLIGFGRIARELAKRAQALGMKVIYADAVGKFNDMDFEFVTLQELLKRSDFVSLHIPATSDKKPVLGTKEIDQMKDGAYVINTARGGLICEESLLMALDAGKIAGAGLDVFEKEPTKNERLYTHEKVSLSPHIGGATIEAQERIGEEIVSIIKEFFD